MEVVSIGAGIPESSLCYSHLSLGKTLEIDEHILHMSISLWLLQQVMTMCCASLTVLYDAPIHVKCQADSVLGLP